jgi:uncharacterized protein YqgC (DUF456 family)
VIEIVLFAAAGILSLVGIIGCILPAVPGPPISFAALILIWAARDWHAQEFGWPAVAIIGALAALVTVFDTVAPAIGARRYGASRLGVWGSIIGMIVGMIAFPPLGMILGAFVGALTGELIDGKETKASMKASWGVFVYTMLGIVLKLAVSLTVLVLFVLELIPS